MRGAFKQFHPQKKQLSQNLTNDIIRTYSAHIHIIINTVATYQYLDL